MRPTCRRFECPAMPTTSVAKRSGATMVRMRRRKIWLSTRSATATRGSRARPRRRSTIDTRIQVVSDRRATRRRRAGDRQPARNRQQSLGIGAMPAKAEGREHGRQGEEGCGGLGSFDMRRCYTSTFLLSKELPTAEVAELADALASGASGRKAIGVRVPASAPVSRATRDETF